MITLPSLITSKSQFIYREMQTKDTYTDKYMHVCVKERKFKFFIQSYTISIIESGGE